MENNESVNTGTIEGADVKEDTFISNVLGRDLWAELNDGWKSITWREIARFLGFGILALLAIVPMWSASQVVFYAIGVMALVCYANHVFRKLFFPYLDMKKTVTIACQTPAGAAAVVCAMVVMLCVMLFVVVSLIK